MKNGNFKRLAPVVGFVLLCGLIVHGFAVEPAKKPVVAPTAHKPTAAITAPLKAKVDPKLVIEHKLTPIKYVPFTLNDLKDPATGKAPTATTVMALPNGKKVAAAKYLVAINQQEKNLNAWGYSLRGKAETVKLQESNYYLAKLQQDAAKPKVVATLDARATSLLTSPEILQQEFTQASTAAKTSAKVVKPILGTVTAVLQPVTITKSFDDNFGDTSIFAVDVNGSLTLTGAQTSASVAGQARATASILGNTEDLVVATANITAPKTGNLTAQVKVTTLGIDQVVLDQSQAVSWNKTDTFTRSLPDSFKVQYSATIGPIPITATIGAKGSVSIPYYVSLVPSLAEGWMIPDVESSVYGQGGIGIDYDDTGFVAGVEADLTLLNNKLVMFGSASQGSDTKGTFLKYQIVSRNDMTALKGSVSLFVKAEVDGYSIHNFTHELFSFGGLGGTTNPLNGGDTVYLRPPLESEQTTK